MASPRLASVLVLVSTLLPPPASAVPTDGSTLFADRATGGSSVPGHVAHADLFTGAAAFAVPLELPPGTGGLTPRVALQYSSAGGGESWVGVGWSLSVPAVARSLARGVPRYDDGTDEFELEGTRLVAAPGSQPALPRRYHRRRERFERIVHEADGSWTVTSPDGTRRRFGVDADARVAHPVLGRTFQWLLSEEEDLHGNVVRIRYDRRDAGTAYPQEIRYTLRRAPDGTLASLDGDAGRDRVVRFELEPRPDPSSSFASGFERALRHRLRAVHVTVAGEPLRCWQLGYEESLDTARSLLVEVSLFGTDGRCDGAPAPTPPRVSRFTYRRNAGADWPRTGWKEAQAFSWPSDLSLVDGSRQDRGVRLADVDGDGLPDLVKAYAVPGDAPDGHVRSPDSGVYRNTGQGFETQPASQLPLPQMDAVVGALTTSFAREDAGRGVGLGLSLLDLDADGRADLAGGVRWLDPASGSVGTYGVGGLHRNTGSGFERIADPGDLLLDGHWGLARHGLVEFTWLPSGSGFVGSFSSAALPGPARFADLDGDAWPELLVRSSEIRSSWSGRAPPFHPGSETCRLDLASFHFRNRGGLRFERAPFVERQEESDRCGAASFVAVGLEYQPCDYAVEGCQRRLLHDEARSRRFLQDGSYAHWHLHWELGNEAVDLDGDGLADLLGSAVDDVLQRESVSALRNDGAGGYAEASAWLPPARFYEIRSDFSRDLGLRLADVNGDGRLDLVQAAEGGARRTWLNVGEREGAGSAWRASTLWELPPDWSFVDATGQDLGVRLVDVDGDGMADLVRSIGGRHEVRLSRGEVPDLLESVLGPTGSRVHWMYAPSTVFDHREGAGEPDAAPESGARPMLPHVRPLAWGVFVSDGWSEGYTFFDYAGGRYDPDARELRGFRRVVATRDDGRVVRSWFHQDEARAGLLERREVLDEEGPDWPLREEHHRYTTPGNAPPFVALPSERIQVERDAGDVRATAIRFEWDGYGNLVRRTDLGEIAHPPGPALGNLDPSDDRLLEREMALPSGEPGRWIVDRVRRERVREGSGGPVLSETLYLYDGDTTGHGLPLRGLVTQTVRVREPGTASGPTTQLGYDPWGNLAWRRDPRAVAGQGGGTTFFGWDARFHAFPSWVLDSAGHRTTSDTATPEGCSPYPAGAGIVQHERGPNLLPGEPGLRRCLDVFGRVVEERAPLDLARARVVHEDPEVGTPRVHRFERVDESGAERVTTTHLDGFGRARVTRAQGPDGRTVVSLRRFDGYGRLDFEQAPYFEGALPVVTRHEYDVLDRPVRTILPGANRHIDTRYLVRDVEVTDANGLTTRRHVNAFGDVTRVDDPESGVTAFHRDALGRLVRVVDPVGGWTTVSYDRLGRRTRLEDPDTGTTEFLAYDDEDNLLVRRDARGATTWSYDVLGRPLTRTAGGRTDRFSWDSAPRGIGLLAARSDDAGTFRVEAYDALGRVLSDSQEVSGHRFVFAQAYDTLGGIRARTFPGGHELRYERDGSGFLRAVRLGGETLAEALQWDARGRLLAWRAGNGVESTTTFDAATGRLAAVRVAHGAATLEDLAFVLDPGDRLLQIVDRRSGGLGTRAFSHDGLDRLVRATGPFGAGLATATRHYAYDPAGSLLCKDAHAETGCAGGTLSVYPATTGSRPVHAPDRVGGVQAHYDATGNLVRLGARAYAYDALGRLMEVSEAGRVLSSHVYDSGHRRTLWIDHAGPRPVTHHLLRDDFEWDATRRLARISVSLAGRVIATEVRPHAPSPQAGGEAPGARAIAPPRGLALPLLAAPCAGVLSLAGWLVLLRRRGLPPARPALAGISCLAFLLAQLAPARALPDGDLDGNGHLDAADALRAHGIARGERVATPEELAHGDIAPLEAAPESPPRIDAGDLVLLWRTLRGEDVDGDGLRGAEELSLGASPFRSDSDGDGLDDGAEQGLGMPPGDPDADDDGVPDGAEVAGGSDPFTADTDGDGLADGDDPAPREGCTFHHGDHLGSVVLVTRAGGEGEALVLSRAVYAPYGAALTGAPPERGFTGQRFEPAAGLYDYGARWYDPALGRFLQPDPIVPDPLRPRTLNRYAYAEGGPVEHADPTGHASVHFRFFAGTTGPGGFSGIGFSIHGRAHGSDWEWSAQTLAWLDGLEARGPEFSLGTRQFASTDLEPYVNIDWSGRGPSRDARGDGHGLWQSSESKSQPLLGVHQLQPGDYLLTGDAGLAQVIRYADSMNEYGHAAIVLDVRADRVKVLSADENGAYVGWNEHSGVGDRWWMAFRPFGSVDAGALREFATSYPKQAGIVGSPGAYLGNQGGNVCSSIVAAALRASSAVDPKPVVGNLVTPSDLRSYGAPIGRIFIPRRAGWPR